MTTTYPRTAVRTPTLVHCGLLAGPLYAGVALAQGLTRTWFDLTRDDVSLLANGGLGWLQIANFLASGLLTVACAVGLRRLPQLRWGPILLGVYGVGLIAAGVFRADPSNGFPPGTAPGRNTQISWHGMLHLVSAGVGFLGLIAACFVFASRFGALGHRTWAVYSRLTGILFFAGFAAIASGSTSRLVVLAFWVAVLLGWTWIALLATLGKGRIQ